MANIRLKNFPAKPTPVGADIFYLGNSADDFRESKSTAQQVANSLAPFISDEIIANPSNNLYWAPDEFTQNGIATLDSPVITGLGSTSRMYVGMSLSNNVFPPSLTILSIDSDTQITVSGNSSFTGSVTLACETEREGSPTGTGQLTNPGNSYEMLRQLAVNLGAGQGKPFNLIFLGDNVDLGTFNISPFVNVDFNGASFSMTSIVLVGGWDDGNSKILFQNGLLTSTWNLDTSALGVFQKQILWRDINAQNNAIDIIQTGNGSEFFCIASDTAMDAYTITVNKVEIENSNLQVEGWIACVDQIKVTNTSDTANLFTYFNKEIFTSVNIISTGAAQHTFQTKSAFVDGTLTLDGANVFWNTDIGSYKEPILLNGATVQKINVVEGTSNPGHVIQINNGSLDPVTMEPNRTYVASVSSPTPCLFVLSSAAVAGDYVSIIGTGGAGWNLTIGPGTTMIDQFGQTILSLNSINQYNSVKLYCKGSGNYQIVYSTITPITFAGKLSASVPVNPTASFPFVDTAIIDPYDGFDGGAGKYTIPTQVFEVGVYELEYRMNVSTAINGDFNVDLLIDIDGSIDTDSVVTEQQDFNTIGGTLQRSLSGSLMVTLTGTQELTPKIMNNGDMIVDVNSAFFSVKRIY